MILDVSGLTVRFGGVLAVDDVSFDLRAGDIVGVIGPNGAGKTTVFDAISGFVPSRGHVRLDGRDISDFSPEKRSRARLGRSFQDARLFPSLTVSETLAVSLERHMRAHDAVSTAVGAPWVRRAEKRVSRRVDELIELMGLGAFRDKFVSELSTGSRRIVDLAGILAHEPLVLLLDEPSSGIAQRETEALGPLLQHIRKETGASLLVIEHDMPLITSISDEILALETGAVLTRGKPAEVLADPRLVAAYLGTDQAVLERSGMRTDAKPVRAAAKRPPVAKKKAATKKAVAAKKTVSRKAATAKKPAKAAAKKAAASKTMPSRPVKAARKRT